MSKAQFQIDAVQTTADLAASIALFRAYADSLGVDLSYQDFEAELAALPGKYAPPAGELLLARDMGARPLGCVALRPILPEGSQAGYCEMKRLYVAPAARGMGLGRALVEAIIAAAAGLGHREIRLDTLPDMIEAQALYERMGFVRIAPYYETPIAGTVFMARNL